MALPTTAVERIKSPDKGSQPGPDTPGEQPAKSGEAPAKPLSRDGVCSTIVSVARANDLPVPFFANLIWQESNFKAHSVSHAGAQGIAQFMPRTAAGMGLADPFEPIQALVAAGKLLRQLASQFGNFGLAAAAYNAGPKRVSDWLGKRSGLPGETRDYVRKITGRHADHWTSREVARAPEASVMPARAPCTAVAEEVEAQKAAGAAKLLAELAATASSRSEPDAKSLANTKPLTDTPSAETGSFDEAAWSAATAQPSWRRRAVAMVRDVLKRVRASEIREAAAQRVIKASRAAVRIVDRAQAQPSVRTSSEPATRLVRAATKLVQPAAGLVRTDMTKVGRDLRQPAVRGTAQPAIRLVRTDMTKVGRDVGQPAVRGTAQPAIRLVRAELAKPRDVTNRRAKSRPGFKEAKAEPAKVDRRTTKQDPPRRARYASAR
jgi:hypothetical protein